MTERVDKDSMECNKPRRTPGHSEKSHIVKACYDGQEKIIRFGEQGASTAGKPKAGESERMTQKRASFKARHAKNIAKGKSSAAYWADRVKWASGGPVELREMYAKYAEGGAVKKDDDLRGLVNSMRKMFSLDTPKDMTAGETVADIAAGFVPGLGTAQAARDFERARREGDKLGMGLAGVGMIPVVGGMTKVAKAATKVPDVKEQKMLMGVYRGYAGDNPSPLVHYHGGTYKPGDPVTQPLYLTRDPDLARSYAEVKGGELVKVDPRPRKTASQKTLDELAAEYVPENARSGYTPASALDAALHGERAVNRLQYELSRNPRFYDSAHGMDIGFPSLTGAAPEGEALIMLPGSQVRAVSDVELFTTPQRRVADYYAQKRAAQTGEAPHVEMVLVDPFAGKQYGHSTMGTGRNPPMVTKARKLQPEDVKERTQLYAEGGAVEASTYDPARVDDIVNQIREGIYG